MESEDNMKEIEEEIKQTKASIEKDFKFRFLVAFQCLYCNRIFDEPGEAVKHRVYWCKKPEWKEEHK